MISKVILHAQKLFGLCSFSMHKSWYQKTWNKDHKIQFCDGYKDIQLWSY